MPAFVSLAFGVPGPLEDAVTLVSAALARTGFQPIEQEPGEGQHITTGRLRLDALEVPSVARWYAEDGWTSVTIDIPVDDFEATEAQLGRQRAVLGLVQIGEALLYELGVPYVFVEEEIEASVAPDAFEPGRTPLPGITLVPRQALDAARSRTDLRRVDVWPHAVVLWRRPHPLPHVDPDGEPPRR